MTKTKVQAQDEDMRVFTPELLARSLVDLELRLHHIPWDTKTAFCVVGKSIGPNAERRHYMATNITFVPVEEGQALEPTFTLRRDQAQALMDELYRVGVRPSEQGTAGELAATKAHLKDMRALVAKAIDVPELKPTR